MEHVVIGITGASGSVLALRLLEFLAGQALTLHVVASGQGEQVFAYETGQSLETALEGLRLRPATIRHHAVDDLFAPIASGSFGVDCMAVVPCSMSTAGRLAGGCGDNLLLRAADVCLKEGARLVLVPREAPLHAVHLRNLLTLSELGACILPPVPQFYARPKDWEEALDGMTGRILRSMGFANELYSQWKGVCHENQEN